MSMRAFAQQLVPCSSWLPQLLSCVSLAVRGAGIRGGQNTASSGPRAVPQSHLRIEPRLGLRRAGSIVWPAAGLMDTEIRCFIELEGQHGKGSLRASLSLRRCSPGLIAREPLACR